MISDGWGRLTEQAVDFQAPKPWRQYLTTNQYFSPLELTKDLMRRYYLNLWGRKLPMGQALRKAQLWLLQEGKEHRELFARGLEVEGAKEPKPTKVPDRTPPVYWAAWTLSGAWR